MCGLGNSAGVIRPGDEAAWEGFQPWRRDAENEVSAICAHCFPQYFPQYFTARPMATPTV